VRRALRLLGYVLIGLVAGVSVAIVLLGLGIVYGVPFVLHELPFMGKTFDPGAWAQAGDCKGLTDLRCEEKWQRCERGPMVRTLLRDHLIVGKTRKDEVLAILGAQSPSVRNQLTCIKYPLGYCSGLGVDYDVVQVCFDDADVLVSKARFQT
jgi:hypothetical protein